MRARHIHLLLFLALLPLIGIAEEPSPAVLTQIPASGIITPSSSPSPSPTPVAVAQPSATERPTPNSEGKVQEGSKFNANLLGGGEQVLDNEERAGIEITHAWREKSYSSLKSQAGIDGTVKFEYGESYPAIVCAILQVTDVELEPGETVTALNVGDTTRWSVESAVSGNGASQVQHLIIKPRDTGLTTSLVATTDRRTYHLVLVSDQTEFMHSVRFVYGAERPLAETAPTPIAVAQTDPPKETADPGAPKRYRRSEGKQVSLIKSGSDEVADRSYKVSGSADWKPVTVYTQGGKTYIEMPASVRHKEAPVLFEEIKKSWFHHEQVLVNYRVKARWYVVDKVIDHGALVSGVGSNRTRVAIDHMEKANNE